MDLSATQPGVNIAGYFKGVMGTGEHARQLLTALRTQGIPVALTTLHPEAAPEDEWLAVVPGPAGNAGCSPSFNLLCVNADSVPAVAARLGDEFFAERYTVGFWAWEVATFPTRFSEACRFVDEVWVGSNHVRDSVGAVATVPVLTIPQPVSLGTDAVTAAPPGDLPDGFRFLFAFDYLSVFERKNPLAIVEAFTRAFAPGSGAVLIIKTLNEDHHPRAHERLRAAVAAHPDVYLIEERLPRPQRDGLMNAADCYVSLHRAEGFGYTIAEAMWLGKPVIATGYSGNLDYMSDANSYLVSHRLVPIGRGHDPYPAEGVWADPDVEHAAALMREVFEHPDQARSRGRRAAVDIRANHAPEVAGMAIAKRLNLLTASPPRHQAARRGSIYTEWVSQMIRSGPVPPRRPRFGSLQLAARRAMLRALKPITVHQSLVDAELLKAIQAIDARVQSLAEDHARALRTIAQLEAELRQRRRETE